MICSGDRDYGVSDGTLECKKEQPKLDIRTMYIGHIPLVIFYNWSWSWVFYIQFINIFLILKKMFSSRMKDADAPIPISKIVNGTKTCGPPSASATSFRFSGGWGF